MTTTLTISKKYKKAQKASILWIIIFFITMLFSCILSVFLLGLCGYAAYHLLSLFRLGWLSLMGAAGLVIMGLLMVFFNIKFILSFFKNYDPVGIEITASEEPELFDLINETVKEVGTKFPKKVYLIEDINASVYYSNNIQSLFLPTPKNLNIGMGVLHMVTVDELKGILAHEFGHFSQKSMTIGTYVSNINRSIYQVLYNENSITAVVEDIAHWNAFVSLICRGAIIYTQMISFLLKKIYHQLEIQNLALSREMEFNADEIAVSVVGYETYKRPLLRTSFYDRCFNEVKNLYSNHIEEKLYTKNIYNNYNQVVDYRIKTNNYPTYKGLADLAINENSYEILRIEYEDLWSSHPETKDRLENVKRLGIESKEDHTPIATTLLKHLQQFEESLTEDMFIHSSIMRKNEISDSEFISMWIADEKQYTFAKEYHHFFNESSFDFKAIIDETETAYCTLSFDEIFNPHYLAPLYKQNRVYKEINLLHYLIQQKEYKQVKFGHKYYNLKKEADQLIDILQTEAASYQPEIDIIHQTVISFFRSNLDDEKLDQFKQLVELEEKLSSNIPYAEEFREGMNWVFHQNHEKVLRENLKILHEKNIELKNRLKEIITFERIKTFYTQEQIDQLQSFINLDQLFYVEGYNANEMNDLFYALDMLEGISNAIIFDQKNQLLRQFLPTQQPEFA